MLFNSYLFIFCFLPIVWAVFHILKALSIRAIESKRPQLESLESTAQSKALDSAVYMSLAKGFLVLASLCFYAYWKLIYLPILLGSIVVNYCVAKGIVRSFAKQIVDSNGGVT